MDVVDAKIAAAEARGATALATAMGEVRVEFAALRGDIREVKASMASKGTVVVTAISLFFGIAGLLIAFLTFGGQWFGLGMDAGTVAQAAAERALSAHQPVAPPE